MSVIKVFKKYKSEVEKWCAKDMNGCLDVSNYVNVILAIMMVESVEKVMILCNLLNVPKKYRKYSRKPNSIKDPKYSIECGVKRFCGCTFTKVLLRDLLIMMLCLLRLML